MISILVDVSSPTNWSHRLSFFAMVIALFAGFLSRLLLRRLLSPFTRRGTASSCADYARILGLLHLTQLLETRVMFHSPYPTLILHGGIGPVDEFEVSISHSTSFVPGHDVSPVSLCEASESFSQQHHDLATRVQVLGKNLLATEYVVDAWSRAGLAWFFLKSMVRLPSITGN